VLDKRHQKYSQEFYHLLSLIKKAGDKKQNYLFIKQRGNNRQILQLLLNEGFINSYRSYSNLVVIRLNILASKKPFNDIIISKKNISLNDLKKTQRREGGSAYYILNSNKGLITGFKAIEKNVGGQLLAKII
jgi:ribosomal protein S8